MDIEKKIELVKQVGEEIVGLDELKLLFEKKEKNEIQKIIAYDGFEPSGQIHIAQGLLRAIQVNKLTKCGITFVFWIADYFAWLNNKLGGDLEKIKDCGKYLLEVWKSCNMNLENVKFKWTSEELKNNQKYWEDFLKLSKIPTITRVLRCGQIMGRSENTENPTSQIVYPLMQANDIHYLNADICQLGIDQRKVNMLARDIFPKMNWKKPIIISHHMLLGLQKNSNVEKKEFEFKLGFEEKLKFPDSENLFLKDSPNDAFLFYIYENEKIIEEFKIQDGTKKQFKNYEIEFIFTQEAYKIKFYVDKNPIDKKIEMKMSKSKPETAIFMTDTKEEVESKFKKAYCEEGIIEENPILEYFKYIIFEKYESVRIIRPEKFGGEYKANSYIQLEEEFKSGIIKSIDLKSMCSKYINELLEPTRKYFEENKEAKELLEKIKSYQITR